MFAGEKQSETVYTYDSYNRLTSVSVGGEQTSYQYDGDDVRVTTSRGGSTVYQLVDRGYVIKQTVVTGEEQQSVSYVRGLGYISRQAGAHTSYYFDNGQGDIIKTEGSDGTDENRYEYDIFGEATLCIEAYENPFRYRGEQYDSETGNIYLRSRYYSPTQGRFLTQDSFAGIQSKPNTLNLYAYCGNDPVNNIDPSGHLFAGPDYEAWIAGQQNSGGTDYAALRQEMQKLIADLEKLKAENERKDEENEYEKKQREMEEQLSSGHRAQLEAGRKYDSGEDTLYNAQIDYIMEMNDVDFGTALDYYVSDVMNESNKYGTDDITEAMISHIAEKHSVDRGIAELMAQADKKNKTNKYGTFDVYRELTHEESKESEVKDKDPTERGELVVPGYNPPPPQQETHDPDWSPGLYIDPSDANAAYKILEELRKLTDDIIDWDPKTGKVIIKKRNKGRKTKGTDFIRKLISSEDDRFTIQRNKQKTNTAIYEKDENGIAKGDSHIININDPKPDEKEYILLQDETGKTYFSPVSAHMEITLGHELIHAYRRATNTSSHDPGERWYVLPDGEIEWEYTEGKITVEEFETTGLGYRYGLNYNETSNVEEKRRAAEEYVETNPELNLTENALRREQGLDIRVAYKTYKKQADGSFRKVKQGENN